MSASVPTGRCAAVLALALMGCLKPDSQSGTRARLGGEAALKKAEALTPLACSGCHPDHFREWRSSIMAYSTVSPSFHAMEVMGNVALDGRFRRADQSPGFCITCHYLQDSKLRAWPLYKTGDEIKPFANYMDEVARHGVSCDGCHQSIHTATPPDSLTDAAKIEYLELAWEPMPGRVGPIDNPIASKFHVNAKSDVISTSEFCAACHQVHISGADPVTGEPFKRLQNTYDEWKASPYATAANPSGKRLVCQDCHMSLYPYRPAGTYAESKVAVDGGGRWASPVRKHASHYFTGVENQLVDSPDFDDESLDANGVPRGYSQRRRDMLRAVCTFVLEPLPQVINGGAVVPIRFTTTNVGAGHRFPSGFSKLRDFWIELTVKDGSGKVLYRSGFLTDRAHPETGELAGDNRLNDEDLEEFIWSVDADTLRTKVFEKGPDFNERPAGKKRGLVSYRDRLLGKRNGKFEIEQAIPYFADAVDNTRGLPPLVPQSAQYDVTVPVGAKGPIKVEARLLFRGFMPIFLRALGARTGLITEEMVDRNEIVEMAVAAGQVAEVR